MSDYVEARYALLTLEQARASTEDQATSLLNGLLQDLSLTEKSDLPRADTLASIRHLAVVLCEHRTSPKPCWDAAYEAAHAWRDQAYR
jgi:hypothetical protein